MNYSIQTYLQAGYPGLILLTPEEARAEAEVATACTQLDRHLHAWSATEGLCDLVRGSVHPCTDPVDAIRHVSTLFALEGVRHAVLMRDLQLHLDHNDPLLVRQLRDVLRLAKSNGHALILAGCRIKLPAELEHEFAQIELPLPGTEALGDVLDGILSSASLPSLGPSDRETILNAALGLTTIESENAFALSLVECGRLDPERIAREKANLIRRGGLLEVVDQRCDLSGVGGLYGLKQWLEGRASAFTKPAQDYGLPHPKGLLIVGIPGTGKSLTAKATADALGLPLLRLDIGRVFGGIVGQSEANLRSVIRTAEAIAPCVLWIDEIEKGFGSNAGGGGSDGGTSSRVFGSFLSWMQEKAKPVFVVATANDVSKLPPEFLRKGRFDELFFVDLPSVDERTDIWRIVISRSGRDPASYDCLELAQCCENCTGAEIEAAWNDAMHEAFAAGREPSKNDLMIAITASIPLAKLAPEKIESLRAWSKGRTRDASKVATLATSKRSRRRVQELN